MSKRRFKKGVKSIQQEIHLHKHIKLTATLAGENTELARYYEKEIKRLEKQLADKEKKLLPRSRRLNPLS